METLKLMIRAKRFFRSRERVLEVFRTIEEMQGEMERFKGIVEKHDSF